MKVIYCILFTLIYAQMSFGQLSGPLSGTYGPGIYHVVGTISVGAEDSVQLMPGTTFTFDGPYPFWIYGTLVAEGTEYDSIIFTTDTVANPDRWRGLRFESFENAGSSGSRLAFCLIENGYAIGAWPNECGGGIDCHYSSPSFTNCIVRGSSAFCGAGVACIYYASPTFTNCTISGNIGVDRTVGANQEPVIVGLESMGAVNRAYRSSLRNGAPFGGFGGGVYSDESSPTFKDCIISGNSAMYGGGVRCDSWPSSSLYQTFTNCIISGNSAEYYGGVCCWNSTTILNNTIIAFSEGEGIFFKGSSTSQIAHCNFYENTGGDFVFEDDYPPHGPPGIGELVSTNENGDSCDVYFNIFCDPMFADTANDDYHLTASSCCIDAGNPCQLDPDTTILDIGVFYYHHSWPDYDPSKEIYLCYSVEETGRYVSWRPFANATGYKLYRTTQVDLPLNQWDLVTTTPSSEWDYLDTEAFDSTKRYFYQVVVIY